MNRRGFLSLLCSVATLLGVKRKNLSTSVDGVTIPYDVLSVLDRSQVYCLDRPLPCEKCQCTRSISGIRSMLHRTTPWHHDKQLTAIRRECKVSCPGCNHVRDLVLYTIYNPVSGKIDYDSIQQTGRYAYLGNTSYFGGRIAAWQPEAARR